MTGKTQTKHRDKKQRHIQKPMQETMTTMTVTNKLIVAEKC